MSQQLGERQLLKNRIDAVIRFRWRALVTFALLMTMVVVGVAVATRVYRSEAVVFLRLGRESITLDAAATTGQTVGINETRETEIESARQLLASRGIRERVVDRLTPEFILNPPPPGVKPGGAKSTAPSWNPITPIWNSFYSAMNAIGLADGVGQREKAVSELGGMLSASVREQTSIIDIACESESPEHAQQILQVVIEEFRADHQRAHRSNGSLDFFDQETADSNLKLKEASQQLRDLKNEYSILSIQGRRDALQSQISAVEVQQLSTDSELAFANQRLESLDKASSELPKEVIVERSEGLANEAADEMRQQLYQLEIREQELLATRTPAHPSVQAIRSQVKEVRNILDKQQSPRDSWKLGPNPIRQPIEIKYQEELANVAALTRKVERLKKQHADLIEEGRVLNKREIEIAQLEREVGRFEAAYQSNSERLEQARIAQGLELSKVSNVNLIQEPSLVGKPVRPMKMVCFAVGFVFSCIAAASVVYLSALWDDRLHSVEEIEDAIDLPVVATIPRMADRVANGVG